MANCRHTLKKELGIPNNKIYFGHEYPDRNDMEQGSKKESASTLNKLASELRTQHNEAMEEDVVGMGQYDYGSDPESEDEANIIVEDESNYGEDAPKKRKNPLKLTKKT